MKIVAKTQNGYMIAATEDELAHLVGHHYPRGLESAGVELKIGTLIQIGEMWNRLYRLAQTRDALGNAADTLRKAADAVVEVAPILCPPGVEGP